MTDTTDNYSKGKLLDLLRPRKIWVAVFYRHGSENLMYASRTEEGVVRQAAGYCRKHWRWRGPMPKRKPRKVRQPVRDAKVIEVYCKHRPPARLETAEVNLTDAGWDTLWIATTSVWREGMIMTSDSRERLLDRLALWCKPGGWEEQPNRSQTPEDPANFSRSFYARGRGQWETLYVRKVPIHD